MRTGTVKSKRARAYGGMLYDNRRRADPEGIVVYTDSPA